MNVGTIRSYIASLFPGDTIVSGASYTEPSISIFPAPESRAGRTSFVGGPECDDYKRYPVNILVRWSDDISLAEPKANSVYEAIKDKNNFTYGGVDFAFISMLDDGPIYVGRDSKNVTEFTIRADFYYYS